VNSNREDPIGCRCDLELIPMLGLPPNLSPDRGNYVILGAACVPTNTGPCVHRSRGAGGSVQRVRRRGGRARRVWGGAGAALRLPVASAVWERLQIVSGGVADALLAFDGAHLVDWFHGVGGRVWVWLLRQG
jgi:hypothetical protein